VIEVKKKANRRRPIMLRVYVNEEEEKEIKAKAGDNFSTWARNILIKQQ